MTCRKKTHKLVTCMNYILKNFNAKFFVYREKKYFLILLKEKRENDVVLIRK